MLNHVRLAKLEMKSNRKRGRTLRKRMHSKKLIAHQHGARYNSFIVMMYENRKRKTKKGKKKNERQKLRLTDATHHHESNIALDV